VDAQAGVGGVLADDWNAPPASARVPCPMRTGHGWVQRLGQDRAFTAQRVASGACSDALGEGVLEAVG
jgi:hypothetical protein